MVGLLIWGTDLFLAWSNPAQIHTTSITLALLLGVVGTTLAVIVLCAWVLWPDIGARTRRVAAGAAHLIGILLALLRFTTRGPSTTIHWYLDAEDDLVSGGVFATAAAYLLGAMPGAEIGHRIAGGTNGDIAAMVVGALAGALVGWIAMTIRSGSGSGSGSESTPHR